MSHPNNSILGNVFGMIGMGIAIVTTMGLIATLAEQMAEKSGQMPFGNKIEFFLGSAIGAITFSGSVIAFGKLSGKYKFCLFLGAPVTFAGQHMLSTWCWG